MKVSKRGLVEIASHEGIVPMPYFDSQGVLTCFVGHTKAAGSPYPENLPFGVEQPMEKVFRVFQRDLQKYADDVAKAVKVPLKQHERDALISFHYNCGGIFRAKLTKHLNAGDREAAADAFMGWSRPPEIISRRLKEQSLFRTGSYASGGWATVYRASKAGQIVWSSGKRVNVLEMLEGKQQPDPVTAMLDLGSVGDDVRRVQRKLGIVADGIFGPATHGAVTAYQKKHGLTVDGICGPQTLGHLGLA